MAQGSVVPEVIALRSSASLTITLHGLVMTFSLHCDASVTAEYSDHVSRVLALVTSNGPKRVCDSEAANTASQAIAGFNRRSKWIPAYTRERLFSSWA